MTTTPSQLQYEHAGEQNVRRFREIHDLVLAEIRGLTAMTVLDEVPGSVPAPGIGNGR